MQPAPQPAPGSVLAPQPARPLQQLALLLSTLLLGFVLLFGWLSWRSEKADQITAMQTVLELGEKALDRYFVQVDTGLHALALELGAQGGLADLQQAQRLLQRYHRLHPETASVNLLRLDGQVLASSVRRRPAGSLAGSPGGSADGHPPDGLPTLAQVPSFRVFLDDLPPGTRLDLGRPLAGVLSQQWVFPMRQVLRDDQGRPAAVLAVGMPVALLQDFWRDVPAFGKASIGLIRDDGYLLSRYPPPAVPDEAVLYSQPRQGALRQHLVATRYPARGYVEGPNQTSGTLHGNVFMRLQHYPVTLFVSMPATEFLVAWWQRVRVPFLLVGLLGGVGMFGYGHMLRRQQAWAAERRQAEAVLRTSEQEQRFLLDHLLAGVIVHGPDGAVLRCNAQAALLMGLSEAQMLGKMLIDPAWHFVREDGSPMPVSDYPVQQVLRSGTPVRGLVLGVMQPGRAQPVWLLGDAYPEAYPEHNAGSGAAPAIRRVVVTFVDISGRRQVEQTLADSERRYRLLFDNSLEGVLQTRPDGSVLSANPAACSIFGLDEAALRARGRSGLVDPGDPRVAVLMAQRARDGRTRGEITMLRGDGSPFEAEVSSVLYTDDAGQPLSSLLLRDVTNRRQAEAALAAKDLAEQANHAKSAFMARMSHELRTPLNAILGFSQVLVDDADAALTPLQIQRVQHIRRAGEHLLSLINDLLDLSRIESGALHLAVDTVDVAALAQHAVHAVADQAAVQGIQVSLHLPAATLPPWHGDSTRLHQVLLNLLSNAVKYNRAGGSVAVLVRQAEAEPGGGPAPQAGGGAALQISVRDSGLGMTPAQQQALFQPFNRLGREATPVEGTGIGLVITRSLVQLMGGHISVASLPGQGTEFMLRLPRATPPGGAGAAGAANVVGAAGTAAGGMPGLALPASTAAAQPGGHVLYIDDDSVNRLLMQALLNTWPGLQLSLAADGASGLALALQAVPDLLLIDMMMPVMDGLQVLAAVRSHPVLCAIPCIAVSANAMPQEIDDALAAGFDGYLTKPLLAPVLLAEIDRALRLRRQPLAAPQAPAAEMPI